MLWAAALLSAGGELYSAADFKPERNHPQSAQSQATVASKAFICVWILMHRQDKLMSTI